jgi:predicted neutral ceramidase superfamily lipid hydrolase
MKQLKIPALIRKAKKYVDFRMGALGALVMAAIVFMVNYCKTHEILGSTTASVKQFVYTLIFGGVIIRTCENLAVRINKERTALFLAVLIPSLTAIILTFLVHSMRGTPHPLASTIPTGILVIPTTAIWGKRKRNRARHSANEGRGLNG